MGVVIPLGTYPFRIVSCYQVGIQDSQFRALSDPLDGPTWTLMVTSFTAVILFFALIPDSNWFITLGVLLENSVVGEPKSVTRGMPGYTTGVEAVLLLWTVLVGTVLTNWYKSAFTIDMIRPVAVLAPWENITGFKNVRMAMRFQTVDTGVGGGLSTSVQIHLSNGE